MAVIGLGPGGSYNPDDPTSYYDPGGQVPPGSNPTQPAGQPPPWQMPPNGPPPPAGGYAPGSASAPPPPAADPDAALKAQIASAYTTYLGRPIQTPEYDAWIGNPNWLQGIQGSPEAQAYKTKAGGPPTTQGQGGGLGSQQAALQYAIGSLGLKGQAAVDWVHQNYPQWGVSGYGIQYYPQTNQYGGNGWYAAPGSGQFGFDWVQRAPNDQLVHSGNTSTPTSPFMGGAAPSGTGMPPMQGGVFTDPATAQWQSVLNQVAARLQQPMVPQDSGAFTDYLRSYFQQLQGPAYTPSEMELMQTQSLDPMEVQRQSAIQSVIQRFSRLGQGPSSGTVQSAINDVNRQFDQLRTRTQADFATGAIHQTQANRAQAAQIGGALTGYEQSLLQNDESRALQGVGLLGQIPQLADSRLMMAMQLLGQNSPASVSPLLSALNGFQNTGLQATSIGNSAAYQAAALALQQQQLAQQAGQNQFNNQQTLGGQSSQYWMQLAQMLMGSGLFG